MAKIRRHFSVALITLFLLLGCGIPLRAQIGGVDASFIPGAILNGAASGVVRALVVQSDGKVIVAGDFTSIGGTARGRIARLNADGTLDTSFATASGADGPINALAVQTDGKIVIGGEFTTINGTGRNRIARLTTTGALDATFVVGTGANGMVNAIAIVGSSIYIGGDFTQVNAAARVRLARLGSTGTVDSFMNGLSGPNAAVHALSYDGSSGGTLYIGGAFTTFNGSTRNRLASFDTFFNSLDSFFNSSGGPDGTVFAMLLKPSGFNPDTQLFIGGDFTSIGTTPRGRVALLNPSASPFESLVDPGFSVFVDARVRCLALQSGGTAGRLILGGDFTQLDGQARARIARIASSSDQGNSSALYWDLDTAFGSPAGANASVRALGLTTDSKTVLGGEFSSIAGTARQSIARLYSDAGSLPPSTPTGLAVSAVSASQIIVTFNGTANATAYKIERSPDGVGGWTQAALQSGTSFTDSALAAGTPYFYRASARNSNGDSAPTASVNATTAATEWTAAGALDPAAAAAAGADGTINAVAYQPDGAVLVAGSFTTLHGVARRNIARLLPDWTIDPAFDPGVGPDGAVYGVAIQPDGKIMLAGTFSNVAGTARKYLARLHADGTLDVTFSAGTGPSSYAEHLALQADGRVIIAGSFSTVNGAGHPNIARLNSDGSVDPTFTGSTSSSINAVSIQRDGRILIGGFFSQVNAVFSDYVMRLMPDGSTDPSFDVGSISFVEDVVALANGKILVCGWFTSVNGTTRNRVARFHADGSLDTTFNPGTGPDTIVYQMAPQYDGKVIIAGSFNKVAGVARPHIARLNADGTLDTTFQPGAGTTGTINAIAVADDTRIVIGGDFTSFGIDTTLPRVARLLGDGVAAAPPTPTGLSASTVSASRLALSWNDQPAEQSWTLERSPDGTTAWTALPALPWDVTSTTDTPLAAGTLYYYRLRAVNAAGASAYSAIASGETLSLFEQWKLDSGLSLSALEDSDDDGDGIGLLVEYSLALNPAVASTDGMPVGQVIGGALAMSYRKFRSDVSYLVEASPDMQAWSPAGVNQGTGGFPIAWKLIDGAPQMFLRLRVTQP